MARNVSFAQGTAASVGASLVYGGVYYLSPQLHPMSAESIWATRSLIAIPFLILVLAGFRQWGLVTEVWNRAKQRPLLLGQLTFTGFLLGSLLWIFAWAPMNGRGLEVALGFFLFPLVLVALGKFLYKDALRVWHWVAAALALVGVVLQVVLVGGISWETVYVTVGYPLYFCVRRALNVDHAGGLFWEMVLTVPVLVAILAWEIVVRAPFHEEANLLWLAPIYALAASAALLMYIVASRLLPVSVFGLLSYLQPVVLVGASLLIGERLSGLEAISYAFVSSALLLLLVGGTLQIVQEKRATHGRQQ